MFHYLIFAVECALDVNFWQFGFESNLGYAEGKVKGAKWRTVMREKRIKVSVLVSGEERGGELTSCQ